MSKAKIVQEVKFGDAVRVTKEVLPEHEIYKQQVLYVSYETKASGKNVYLLEMRTGTGELVPFRAYNYEIEKV